MRVADAVGRALVERGVSQVFGVVGSGNFHVTNAMIAGGAEFVAARHEHGATMMADGYSRLTGRVAVVSLHQGCGLTNAMTAITEAAKSRTPVLVVTADTPGQDRYTSNFWIDQKNAVRALGAESVSLHTPESAIGDALRAYDMALSEKRTVVLNMPLDVQDAEVEVAAAVAPQPVVHPPAPTDAAVEEIARILHGARRPLILAGRGARHARHELERLAEVSGALLATSAVARGLFSSNPWSLDVMGGFSPPEVAALAADADVIVGFGVALNRWTARNGDLVRNATLVHVDVERGAIGRHRPVDLGVVADAAVTAAAVAQRMEPQEGYRTAEVRERIATGARWQDVPFEDTSTDALIDPRALTIALDTMLPEQRVVVPDGGNFTGYPAMFLSVPDAEGFCLPLAFQSIGLALAASVGAAVARPDRQVVAGVGDGGFMMSLVELDTAVRLGLPLLVIVYNDSAYGAEVHHFAGSDMSTVEFPDTDIAAIARGFECESVTVRDVKDLEHVRAWLDGERTRPMIIDAKITSFRSWVEEHVFDEAEHGAEHEPDARTERVGIEV